MNKFMYKYIWNKWRIHQKHKETTKQKKWHKHTFLHLELYLDTQIGKERSQNWTQEKKDATDTSNQQVRRTLYSDLILKLVQ